MRRWMASPLVFAALALTMFADDTPAAAQAKGVEETFLTADGVRLRGLFHKSTKADERVPPVVVFLYTPGIDKSMTKGNWESMANKLNSEGFHVFRFDWRGHGKSIDIVDPAGSNDMANMTGFWANRITGDINRRSFPGWNKKPLKNDIHAKEIKPGYFPMYLQDLAAVRTHLDSKNDLGEVNTSSIYIIGTDDTAALGFLWLTAEWNRPSVHPVLLGGETYKVCPDPRLVAELDAGKDFAGAIWLTASRPSNVPSMSSGKLYQTWVVNTVRLRDNNPMLFLYGEKDTAGDTQTDFYFDQVLVANGKGPAKKLEQTFRRSIPGTNIKGLGLLDPALKVEDTIVEYLKARQKDRVTMVRKNRGYSNPYYINLPAFGVNP